MWPAIKAGAAYFALVFMAGFVLGIIRVLALAPRMGAFRAVMLELRVILTVSWLACGWTLRRFSLEARAEPRIAMGVVAFALLMLAEAMLALATGRGGAAYLASFATAAGAVGLAGQIAFALFPWVRRRAAPRDASSRRTESGRYS